MGTFKTFTQFLEQRAAETPIFTDQRRAAIDDGEIDPIDEPMTGGDSAFPGPPSGQGQVAERSMFRGLFKAVNPARPVSPNNSRLLSSPFRKRRLKSQVMGR